MIEAAYGLGVFALILCSAFFSVAEVSYMLASPVTLRHWAEEGNKRARLAADILEDDTNRVLATISIGDTVVNLLATVLGMYYLIQTTTMKGFVGGMAVLFLILLIVGEMVPRTIAQRYENRAFCRTAGVLKVLMTLFAPFTYVFSGGGKVVIERGADDVEDEYVEEELLNMLDEAEIGGGLESHESDLIRSAINFEELTVRDILRPRVRVVAISDEMDVRDVLDVFAETGYSRLPVYRDSIDNIIGVLHLKDVFNTMLDGELREYLTLVQPVGFVFMQTKASRLLLTLQRTQSHMAIITDEYGGTAGIVTLEDILEELVGEIWDEHDEVINYFTKIDDETYFVDGRAELVDFFKEFGIDKDESENYDSQTVSGWVIEQIGDIPKKFQSFEFQSLTIIVERVTQRRILGVKVKIHQPEKEDDKENKKEESDEK